MWTSLLLLIAAFSPAAAQTQICVEYRVDYTDNSTLNDYFTDNSNKPAWGILIYVHEVNGPPQSAFADWTGPDEGCATFHLDPSKKYTVTAGTRSRIRDNLIHITDANGHYIWSAKRTFEGSQTAVTLRLPIADEWNVAAAMGWAMVRRNGSLTNLVFTTVLDDCLGSPGACYKPVENKVYISTSRVQQKFIIVHEMGHALQDYINDEDNAYTEAPYDADPGSCPGHSPYEVAGHSFNTKEYTSAAFVEGFAHFYAALAFNNNLENQDCWWVYPGLDWNHNGSYEPYEFDEAFSCATGNLAGPIPDFNYYDMYCANSGIDAARGNEYDWLRFFWHLTSRQDPHGTIVSFSQVVSAIHEADPTFWAATGNGPLAYWPYQKLETGAYSVSTAVGDAWSHWGGLHGLDR